MDVLRRFRDHLSGYEWVCLFFLRCQCPGEGASVDELCARAVERGFSTVAVTDHFDIDGIYEGYFPPLDFEGVRRDVFAAKEKYAGKLTLLYGLELGQGPHMKAQAEETLARYDFEYVIGSVHAVRGIIDFASTAYDQMTDGQLRGLLDQYIEELFELIEWGHFSTLAHITYPYRYFRKHNRAYLLPQGREAELAMFDGVLRALIASDKPRTRWHISPPTYPEYAAGAIGCSSMTTPPLIFSAATASI